MEHVDILIVVENGVVSEIWKSTFAWDANVKCLVVDMDVQDEGTEDTARQTYEDLVKSMRQSGDR